MSVNHLFIGGPFDGQIRDIPSDSPVYRYVQLTDRPSKMSRDADPFPLCAQQREYRRHAFNTDTGEDVEVFVEQDLTALDALKKLLLAYVPSTAADYKFNLGPPITDITATAMEDKLY